MLKEIAWYQEQSDMCEADIRAAGIELSVGREKVAGVHAATAQARATLMLVTLMRDRDYDEKEPA